MHSFNRTAKLLNRSLLEVAITAAIKEDFDADVEGTANFIVTHFHNTGVVPGFVTKFCNRVLGGHIPIRKVSQNVQVFSSRCRYQEHG